MQTRLSYKLIIGMIAASFLLVRCTYEPKETFYNPIAEPEPIRVSVDLLSPAFSDPFYLDFTTAFTFSVANTSKPLAHHAVILNGNRPIHSTISPLGKVINFELNPLTIGTGTYKVRIYLAFETGTNSLAERLGAEFYNYDFEFTIVIVKDPPPLTIPLAAKIENGYLTMRWKPTTQRPPYRFIVNNGFRSTVISSNFNPSGEYIYADSGYVGKPTTYTLSVSNAFGIFQMATASSPPYPYRFVLNTSNPDRYSLEWTSSIYPANVLLAGPNGPAYESITKGLFHLDSLRLGDELNYRLIISRNNHQDQRFDSSFVIKQPTNFRPFNLLMTTSASDVYTVNKGELFRITLPDFKAVDSSQINTGLPHAFHEFHMSRDATFITTLSHGQSVPLLINPNDLKEITSFKALMTNQNGVIVYAMATKHLPASANKLLGATILYNGSPQPILYDLNKDINAWPFDAFIKLDSINEDTPLLSPDGNFYCLNKSDQSRKEVYQNNAGTWHRVGHMPTGEFYFRGDGSLELFSIGNGMVMIYDLAILPGASGPFQTVRTFSLPSLPAGSRPGKVGYDDFSEMLTVQTIDLFDYSTIRLYDIENFSLAGVLKASVKSKDPNNAVRHVYSGGYHFVSTGYAEKVIP